MLALGCENGTIELWSTITNEIQRIIECGSGSVDSVTFSPDDTSTVIVSQNFNDIIRFGDPAKGNLQHTIDERNVTSLAFSPDGNVLATCGDDGRHKLWELASGIIQQTFESHLACFLAFSPNGINRTPTSLSSYMNDWLSLKLMRRDSSTILCKNKLPT